MRHENTNGTSYRRNVSKKKRSCSGAVVLMLSQLVGWVPAGEGMVRRGRRGNGVKETSQKKVKRAV